MKQKKFMYKIIDNEMMCKKEKLKEKLKMYWVMTFYYICAIIGIVMFNQTNRYEWFYIFLGFSFTISVTLAKIVKRMR